LVDIRCYKCGAKSSGDSMEDARSKMDHSIGRSRGIKCGDNYNCIEEIQPKSIPVTVPKQTVNDSFSNVESKSGDVIVSDESQYSTKSKLSKKKSKE